MESSDKTWSLGGRNEKPLQYSCCENPTNMKNMQKQRDKTPEDELSRSKGVQYVTGEGQRAITNSSSKNEEAGPKQECGSVVDVSGGKSKV